MTNPFGRAAASPRTLAAWALLGYAALFLFFTFVEWILPGGASFSARSAGAGFRSLLELGMPVVAVLLAAYVSPPLPGARLITAVALAEYAFAVFFGFVTLLIGLGAVLDHVGNARDAMHAFAYLVLGLGSLVLITIGGYVSLRAFENLGGRLPIGRGAPAPTPPAA